jgi:adenosylcobyric acid synthase
MVQGTSSHVGKSVLAAGLCRLFHQEGLRVAPFKAQNMALNSYATREGGEIGRAQAAQAEAARVPPTVDMNPILLKPEGNAVSQVVVAGQVYGTMSAAEYHREKPKLWPLVEASLRRLLDAFDLVVIEGAGSPVEVNLKAHDLVNMRVATSVGAPVLLVGDIDRGGVFASLVGTMELLDPEERELVAGFIVNKFRGDPALFESGVEFLEARLGRPFLGLVPWIPELGIAEEDSLGLPAATRDGGTAEDARIDVAVIRLPHIANFDDFDPLRARPELNVRFVDRPELLGEPAIVILPGTKTTRSDLAVLQENGLGAAIVAHAQRGGQVMGICGGYQMLGIRIRDPEGTEGPSGELEGLGVLPLVTTFAGEKTVRQVSGRILAHTGWLSAADGEVSGYEIHLGQTAHAERPAFELSDGGSRWSDGLVTANGRVVGTYLHGLFHNPAVIDALIIGLRSQTTNSQPSQPWSGDPYDRLADVLRRSLRMDRLLPLVGLG